MFAGIFVGLWSGFKEGTEEGNAPVSRLGNPRQAVRHSRRETGNVGDQFGVRQNLSEGVTEIVPQ